MSQETLEELARQVQAMGRSEVLEAIGHISTGFPMDFSKAFLDECTEERLKHILLAARLYVKRSK